MKKRIFALVMSVCMLISMIPVSAIASDHVHDASCGYSAASECTHTHDSTCGYAEAVAGSACTHNCSDGTCSYVAASEGSPCGHSHDDSCGYAAVSPCTFVPCDHSHCGYVEGSPCNGDTGCDHLAEDNCGYVEGVDCPNAGQTCDHSTCGYSEGSSCNHSEHTDCGYSAPVKGVACDHSHNSNCGYVEASAASPCTHSCADGTCGYSEGSECTYVEPVHTCEWGEWVANGNSTHTRTCMTDTSHTDTADCAAYAVAKVNEQYHNIVCECMHVLGTESHTMSDWYSDGDGERRDCTDGCDYYENREPHTCTWEWTYDSTLHWQKCSDPDCSESSTAAQAHQFDDDNDAACNTCGYTRTIEHTCNWGEWTFNGDGTHTRVCKEDSSHTESGSCDSFIWLSKSEGHMKSWVCKNVCGGGTEEILSNEYYHEYSNDTDLTCDICGYVRTVEGSLSITGSMPAATVGEVYSASFGYTGTVSGVVFWNATGLPDGLSINAGSGVVSGTPATAGTFSVTIAMGATGGGSASKDFTLTVNAPAHVCGFSIATCTTPATCLDPACGATSGGVDKSNHVGGTEIRNAVAAGEFTEGYTGDTYCKGCGDKLADGETIPATHTHSYGSYAYDRNGHWKVCSCGAATSAEDHDWYIYKKDSKKHYWRCDCGNNGWGNEHFDNNDTGKCDDCGHEMQHTHEWSEWQPTSPDSAYNNTHERYCIHDSCEVERQDCYDGDDADELCDVCGCTIHRHFEGREWKYRNEVEHWKECVCELTTEIESHHFSLDFTVKYNRYDKNYHWYTCYCGYFNETHYESHWNLQCENIGDYDVHGVVCELGCYWEEKHTWSVTGDHEYRCLDCGMLNNNEHLYERWLPSEHNPAKYHVLCCLVCDAVDPEVKATPHTSFEMRYDRDGHWEVCVDCGYTSKIVTSHTLTEFTRSEGRFHYHDALCAECGYVERQNCAFNTYAGNAGGHWLICDLCAKPHSGGVVRDHIDEVFDEKCDVCGVDMEHTEHAYEWSSASEKSHRGVCICGSEIIGLHTDNNMDGKCDGCNIDVKRSMYNSNWFVEYIPADGNTGTGDMQTDDYDLASGDAESIFSGASVDGSTVSFSEDTALGDASFSAGTAYSFDTLYAGNISIDGANGVVALTTNGALGYSEGTQFIAAHLLSDGSVQYAGAVRDGDTVTSKMHITETSPFLILAVTDQAEPSMTRSAFIRLLWAMDGNHAEYADPLSWAAENGLLAIFGKSFEPEAPLTREELAAMLYGYALYRNIDVSVGESTNILSYEDASEISEAAIPAMQWMCGAGLVQDENGYILPHEELPCREAWNVLKAAMDVLAETPFNHTIVRGENLTAIARMYGCTVDEIVELNSDLIENPSKISVGWVLNIPAA